MKLSVKADLRGALRKLEAVGGCSQKVLREQVMVTAVSFTREVATKWTAPAHTFEVETDDVKPKYQTTSGLKAKLLGEEAVRADIRTVYTSPGNLYGLIKAYGGKEVADQYYYLLNNKPEKLPMWLDLSAPDYIRSLGRWDGGDAHRKRRTRRGRVAGSRPSAIVMPNQQRMLAAYIKERQARVGLLASGWMEAARYLGVKLPAWISRHTKGGGSIQKKLLPESVIYRITNNAPHGSGTDTQRRAQACATMKMNQLRRRLPYVIRGEIKKLSLTRA